MDSFRDFRLLSRRYPIANRPHVCSDCPEPIEIGTRYEKLAYLSEGSFWFGTRHVRCPYDHTCGTCGGSGGGPEHLMCLTCGGTRVEGGVLVLGYGLGMPGNLRVVCSEARMGSS